MASLSYRTQVESSTDLTNYTFSSADIGAASVSRLVVVGVTSIAASGSRRVSSMTIGGIAATRAVDENDTGRFVSELWYALVPTGTAANIVVNHDGAMTSCSIGVWALYDVIATPTNTASSFVGSVSINIPAGGIVVANNHTSGAVTWTGATENFDDATLGDASGSGHSGASRQATVAEVGTTVSSSGLNDYLVAAAWAPTPSFPYSPSAFLPFLVR